MLEYQPLRYTVRLPGGSGEFVLDGEWRDITAAGEDKTTWSIRYACGACSFRVTLTGRTARTSEHPIPATEALKLAMVLAVRDEVIRLTAAGRAFGQDHPVTVSERNVSDAVRMTSPTR